MSDALSFAEIAGQYAELLPARTVLTTMSTTPGVEAGDAWGGADNDGGDGWGGDGGKAEGGEAKGGAQWNFNWDGEQRNDLITEGGDAHANGGEGEGGDGGGGAVGGDNKFEDADNKDHGHDK
jgi:hypothetical protein